MQKAVAISVLSILFIGSVGAQSQSAASALQAQNPASRPKTAATRARYLSQLKVSLQKKTDFAVFEPNGEKLWANVRNTITNFLTSEWQSGSLQGAKPQQAFWVKCDRTTMTQNDLDNGRLIVLIGVAQTKPAEFVIIRISQWTEDHHAKRPHK